MRWLVALGLFLAGCPGSPPEPDAGLDASPRDAPPAIDAPPDVPPGPRDAPLDVPDAPAPSCVGRCTTDAECAATCPENPLGATCCDVETGVCYWAMTPSCPIPFDAGPPLGCPASCATSDDCWGCPGSAVSCCHRGACVATSGLWCDRMCVEECTTDADCVGSCPLRPLDDWCCDASGGCSLCPGP